MSEKRLCDVFRYEISDDPHKDGDWRLFSRVRRENLGRSLKKLFDHGYDYPSIDVRDEDGEPIPETEWPR